MKRTKFVGTAMSVGLVVAIAAQADDVVPREPDGPAAKRPKKKEPKIEAKADALLHKMSDDLAALKTFSFDTEHVTEIITTDNQKLQLLASSTVVVQRPNKLRSDRKGPAGDITLFYDGTTLTVFGKRHNLYASAPTPDTLDRTIDYARDALDLDAPAADLLYSDPYSLLMENVVSGRYVDEAIMGGRVCKHLAYRGTEADFEIWIEDAKQALPCRFVITTKDVKGWPQYEVELTNWKTLSAVPDKTFAFTPPRGAGKINFLAVAKAQKAQKKGKVH